MKALIFGSNGQDGYYLTKLLESQSIEVVGLSRKNAEFVADVSDYDLVEKLVKNHKPQFIFHFAANSTTKHDALWDNHKAISTGTLNILESVKSHSPSTKVFLSGSALQFVNKGLPIDESSELSSSSAYVVSRNHSLYAARYYRSLGLKIYFGYFFNHDSPIRPNRHMAQKIVDYCKNISTNQEKLLIGDISVKKEWTFAGDIVKAVWLFVNQDDFFECVIGSGKSYSIEDWLNICFSLVKKDWHNYVEIESNFISEYQQLVSNPQKLLSLGWKQEVEFEDLAKLMLLN